MELVENATARKAQTEKFITTFARYYTPVVVVIATAIAFVPPLLTSEASFQTWIYRALVLLVISCPCALVVSIPMGYFAGIGRASRKGILVKGSNYIDALSAIGTVVFDKTGTLTKGIFEVRDVVSLNGFSKTQLFEFAAAAEYHSNHPIATSILEAFSESGSELDTTQIFDHTNMAGQGVRVRYGKRNVLVGNDNLLHHYNVDHSKCVFDSTVAHIVVDEVYAGYITIGDLIHPDAAETIKSLRDQNVAHIAMLTGDNQCAAEAVSKRLGLDSFYANLLPEDKVKILEKIARENMETGNKKIAFVGDGINDAPVIARADVGIAMGAFGSDAAIETADVVLMKDSPLKVAEAIMIAKHTRRIVWQNICLAFVIKGIFIVFGAMGLASMWEAVFADMGTALIAVANSTRVIGKRQLAQPQ
jgi:Cd2+/Zn2+-exporting ATPase